MLNCSSTHHKILLPDHLVPEITDQLDMSNNSIDAINETRKYFSSIEALYAQENNISHIAENVLQNGTLKRLNLMSNRLRGLPRSIQDLTSLQELWLSNNAFPCDCGILWMKNWMASFNHSGKRVVQDFYRIDCHFANGSAYQVHALDPVRMKCYPFVFSAKFVKIIASLSGFVTIISILGLSIACNLRECKWLLYATCGFLLTSDKEDLTEKTFDAYFSYR